MPPNLTIRNLTSMPLKITHTSRYPPPRRAPEPITGRNLTDISNLANNLGTFLRRSPISVSSAQLAKNAKLFEETDVAVEIAVYTGRDAGFALGDGAAVLRLDFEVVEHNGAVGKFRVELVHAEEGAEMNVVPLNGGGGGGISLACILHRKRNHLALLSTAEMKAWMGKLKDSTHLGELSIPGTHNSPTYHLALPSVRCQEVSVREQLENGVRFLDVRAQPDGKEIVLVHGAFPIALSGKKTLKDLLKECYDFLQAHKSETIIVSLKREGHGKWDEGEFSKVIKTQVIERNIDMWYVEPEMPRLEKCRGKCILFRRYHLDDSLKSEHGGKGYGINAEAWDYNTPNYTTPSNICVQDFCEVLETQNIDKKIGYVKDHLERSCTQIAAAGKEGKEPPLFINFLSASNFWKVGTWPEKVAAKINPAICEHLAVDHRVEGGNAGTGVVITDFVGEDRNFALFKLVVGMNGGLLV
ncbi:PLC-like phosphodiesterase [Sphaerosporella brunnea]|uniref:PLC-like phosphodiesterase n=1 Tax=Sphaerosporella brunnea TaxID=1250544 RepID=A0A5J5F8T2_9PEZI|nr:PLC-like phosphodiesterase [Sphaerosporella brunnea]